MVGATAARARRIEHRMRGGGGLGQRRVWWLGYMGPRDGIEKETGKSWNPTRYLLTGRSGGNDRMLPPSVRSIPERSKTPRIMTGRVR